MLQFVWSQRVGHDLTTEQPERNKMFFPGSSVGKSPAADTGDLGSIRELGRSLGDGNGNPLQYSYWRIPWTEEPGRLQPMGSQRVSYDLAAKQQLTTNM